MATTTKRSLQTITLFAFITAFVIVFSASCKDKGGDGVWIPMPPDTSALGKIDHFIELSELEQFKKQYIPVRDSIVRGIPGTYLPLSEAFNKTWLVKVLQDPRCVGIRIYYGVKSGSEQGNEFRLMIVGVDEQGKDLYITDGSGVAAQAGGGREGGLEWGQCDPPCSIP